MSVSSDDSRHDRAQERGRTYLEGAEECLVHAHHRSSVVELTAIVRRGEERDEKSLGKELVTILHNLRRES